MAHLEQQKAEAIAALLAGESAHEVARRFGLGRTTVRRWRDEVLPDSQNGPPTTVHQEEEISMALSKPALSGIRQRLTAALLPRRPADPDAWPESTPGPLGLVDPSIGMTGPDGELMHIQDLMSWLQELWPVEHARQPQGAWTAARQVLIADVLASVPAPVKQRYLQTWRELVEAENVAAQVEAELGVGPRQPPNDPKELVAWIREQHGLHAMQEEVRNRAYLFEERIQRARAAHDTAKSELTQAAMVLWSERYAAAYAALETAKMVAQTLVRDVRRACQELDLARNEIESTLRREGIE